MLWDEKPQGCCREADRLEDFGFPFANTAQLVPNCPTPFCPQNRRENKQLSCSRKALSIVRKGGKKQAKPNRRQKHRRNKTGHTGKSKANPSQSPCSPGPVRAPGSSQGAQSPGVVHIQAPDTKRPRLKPWFHH